MIDCSREECVLLHLSAHSDGAESTPAKRAVSIGGICDALDVGAETMADRISVLSAISDLAEDGLVEKRTTDVEGLSGEHAVYTLTPAGTERAESIRRRLGDERIVVETGEGSEELPLSEVSRFFDDSPVARTVSRLSRDGVLRFREGGGEGIVDRESEIERIDELLDVVESGSPRAVMVRGQAGIGKTTLVREATDRAEGRGFEVLWGASRRGTEEAYGPVKSALADATADVDDPFDRDDAHVDDEEGYEAQRSSLFFDVVTTFETLAGDGPIAVVVDDVHRVADSTLELLEHVTHHVDAPVLLVGTHRYEDLPEDHPLSDPEAAGWPDEDRTTWIHLDPLGRSDTRTLIERLVDRVDIPDDFLDRVYEETGGSPLFIEETVNRLLDDGRLDATHGVYPDENSSLPIPDRVESVVDDRLDVLDEAGIDVLERAAVVGESVPFGVLAEVTDRPEGRLQEYVDVLEDSRVLQWEDEDTFRFVSAVIRKAVLEGIDDQRRRNIHERVADAYLAALEDPSDHLATVADHYERAGDAETALGYYRQAADRAREVYAHELAIENYERTLELARELGEDELALETICAIAEVHYLSGNHEEAERYFQYARERTDDPAERLRISYHLVNMCRQRGDHDQGIEIAEEALDDWGGTPIPEAARLLGEKGRCLRNTGDIDGARSLFDRQAELAERVEDDGLLGYAFHNRGMVVLDRGEYDEGIELYRTAIDLLERADEPFRLAKAHNNLGIAYQRNGDLSQAIDEFQECLDIQRRIGDQVGAAITQMNLGAMNFERGRLEEARSQYETAIAAHRKLGQSSSLAFSLGNLADLLVTIGEMDAARERFQECLDYYEDGGPSRYRASFLIRYADFCQLADDFETALKYAERGGDIAADADAKSERAEGLEVAGVVHRERGDLSTAVDVHERYFEICEEIDSPEQQVNGHVTLGRTYLEDGRTDVALDHAESAAQLVEDLPGVWLPLVTRLFRGLCFRDLERYAEAASDLQWVLDGARDVGAENVECETLYHLGLLADRRGDDGAAVERLRSAREVAAAAGFGLYERKATEVLASLDDET